MLIDEFVEVLEHDAHPWHARLVKARTYHSCAVVHADLGCANPVCNGIEPGETYVRVTWFPRGAPQRAALCVDTHAHLFSGLYALD